MRPNVLATSDHPSRLPSVLSVFLGSLEAQVMEVLWTRGECKVRDVMRTLDRDLAYTTVMTTLDRLFRKKLLDRRKSSRAYIYSPRVTCQEWKDQRGPRCCRQVARWAAILTGGPHRLPAGSGRHAGRTSVGVSESDTKKTILRVATTIRLDNLRRPNVILALL